ncbi:MAG: ferredoxin reductase family protein [Roseinatronobacter sp.]
MTRDSSLPAPPPDSANPHHARSDAAHDAAYQAALAHQHRLDRTPTVWAHATALLLLGLLAVASPFLVLRLTDPPPSGSLIWTFSMGIGFGGLGLAALQFALAGRLRWVTHPFGADIVIVAHRYLSWGAVALMLGHFALIYLFYPDLLDTLNPLEAPWQMTAGRGALLCFMALIVTSELRKFLRLRHEVWRSVHLALALIGMGLAIAHIMGAGNLTDTPAKQALWLGATLGFLAVIVHTHLLRPLWARRNPWRVVANRKERGDVHTLELAPEGRALSRWKPGQFAWLKVDRSPFSLIEHPFTISNAPEQGPNIAVSIKPLGDHSAALAQTPIGARAHIDGPYGAFSIDRHAQAPGFVMIAGGVGITPLMANLHALDARADPRPIFLIHGSATWDDASFREELEDIATRLALRVIAVPETPPEDWSGPHGRIDRALLAQCLPEATRRWPHLLCGPKPMLDSVKADLRALGVALRHIDHEQFEMV